MIHKISLTLQKSKDQPIYCIEASRFCELQGGRQIEDIEIPHAFAVPGQSTIPKLIRFCWWNNSQPQFDIGDGRFDLTVYAWSDPKGEPRLVSEHLLRISETQLQEIREFQQENKTTVLETVLDEEPPGNRILAGASRKKLSIP